VKSIAAILIVTLSVAMIASIWIIKDQGVGADSWQSYQTARVDFDELGIPTIEAPTWDDLIEAQGFVTASERLWQMDLLRRSASGQLSEWFGARTIDADKIRIAEDWRGTANRAEALLNDQEKRFCQAYARGVNKFINEKRNAWSLEYSLLRVKPEAWQCRDSILIVLLMADDLSGGAFREAMEYRWQTGLSPEWRAFLFPKYHPWAKPLFGKAASPAVRLPPADQYLPLTKIEGNELAEHFNNEAAAIGSNAWVWAKAGSPTLLANDPHLGQRVPQIWFANRLRLSKEKWVAGVSLPGIPGVVLGMNRDFGWAFTNLGEDVDDYLREQVNDSKDQYLALRKGKKEFWRRIIKKKFPLRVRGQAEELMIEAWFTHRGPLAQRPGLGKDYYSRQWLGFNERIIGMPTVAVNQATNWEEFNTASDRMLLPAQAVLFADRQGNIGFRATGAGVVRSYAEPWLVDGLEGEWLGLKPVADRKRLWLPSKPQEKLPRFIANANAQVWEDPYGERWYAEERRDRIDAVLASASEFNLTDMENLQFDTYSRYHKELLDWVAAHASFVDYEYNGLIAGWKDWSGRGEDNQQVFTQAVAIDRLLMNLLMGRIKKNYYAGVNDLPAYEFRLRKAWVLTLLQDDGNFLAFGIDANELANFLVKELAKKVAGKTWELYADTNRWRGQHPLAKFPVIGQLFKIPEPPQTGFGTMVKAEQPEVGPSFRAVWNLTEPLASSWSFPVGQSGHLRSAHFRDQQKPWFTGRRVPVLDGRYEW